MTHPDLARKSAAMEAVRASWEARLLPAVRAKVDDAHAHASKALTDSLKRTPDGRASLLRLNRSPSFAAAENRLRELATWLTGPGETSLKGKARDAREDLYREACRLWFPLVPPEYRSRSTPDPPASDVRQARAAMVHGLDPRHVVIYAVDSQVNGLKAALVQASRKSTTEAVEDDTLTAWRLRAGNALTRAVRTLLNDSCEWCDNAAGRSLIKPEMILGDE